MILNKYFLKISSSAKQQKSPPPNTANRRQCNRYGQPATPWVSPLEYSQFGGGEIVNENETDKIST